MVNGIKLCTDMLNSAGHDASKEIIFLLGALSTIDPDGPHEALDMVKINNIRCSVVSLSAEGLFENKFYLKGSSDQSHFIFKINVGKRRIRYRTTLNLNDLII